MGPLWLLPTLRLTRKKEPQHLGLLGLQEPHILNATWQAHAECFMESEVFQIYDLPHWTTVYWDAEEAGHLRGPQQERPM